MWLYGCEHTLIEHCECYHMYTCTYMHLSMHTHMHARTHTRTHAHTPQPMPENGGQKMEESNRGQCCRRSIRQS